MLASWLFAWSALSRTAVRSSRRSIIASRRRFRSGFIFGFGGLCFRFGGSCRFGIAPFGIITRGRRGSIFFGRFFVLLAAIIRDVKAAALENQPGARTDQPL